MSEFKYTREHCLDDWQRTLWDAAQAEIIEKIKRVEELADQFAELGNYFAEIAVRHALEGNYTMEEVRSEYWKALDGEQ